MMFGPRPTSQLIHRAAYLLAPAHVAQLGLPPSSCLLQVIDVTTTYLLQTIDAVTTSPLVAAEPRKPCYLPSSKNEHTTHDSVYPSRGTASTISHHI
jgi:hypothetical protein